MRIRAALPGKWGMRVRAAAAQSLPFARDVMVYLSVIGMLGLVGGVGIWRVADAVLAQSAVLDKRPATPAKTAVVLPSPTETAPRTVRQASMALTAEPGTRSVLRPERRGYPVFGTSRRGSFFRDEGEDEDREAQPVFRTLCVRLCDGYYFPISHATTQDRFAKDALTCQSKCGGEAKLFVHRNPGQTQEQMVDLQGRPYAQLPTAFLYRTQYVAQCKCQPDPWDAEAKERHRVYALAESARKGNAQAQVELRELEKARREAQGKVATLNGTAPGDGPLRPAPVLDGEQPMGMGNSPTAKPAPSKGGMPEWARRVFSNY